MILFIQKQRLSFSLCHVCQFINARPLCVRLLLIMFIKVDVFTNIFINKFSTYTNEKKGLFLYIRKGVLLRTREEFTASSLQLPNIFLASLLHNQSNSDSPFYHLCNNLKRTLNLLSTSHIITIGFLSFAAILYPSNKIATQPIK